MLLKLIFEDFNKKNVNYCILRNYDFLLKGEEFYDGKDIDVLIDKESIVKVKKIMRKNGFKKIDLNFASNHMGYVKLLDKRVVSLHFHMNGVSGVNISYLNGKSILERKVKSSFFYHTSKSDLFLVILMHLVWDKRRWINKYIDELTSLVDNVDFGILSKYFGRAESVNIIKQIKNKRLNELNLKHLKRVFFLRNPLLILRFVKFYFLSSFYLLKRIFLRKGALIAVIGMDGTGKTTLTNNLSNYFSKSLVRIQLFYLGRGRDNILPIRKISSLFITKGKENKTLEYSPTVGKPKKFSLVFTIASVLFFLDLFLRYWFRVFPALVKKDIVLADRYITDLYLMNGVPLFLRKLYLLFLPKPNIFIYLYNEVKVLHKRKYHPIEDLKRQQSIFKLFLSQFKAKKIKSVSKEQVFKESVEEIRKWL